LIKTWSTHYKAEESKTVPCCICGGNRFALHYSCGDFAYMRCRSCGLVQINPQPVQSSVEKRYDSEYLNYEIANEKIFLNLALKSLNDGGLEAIIALLQKSDAKNILDIGCATGALLEYLQNRGLAAQGVEISKEQARYAKTRRGLAVSTLPLEENHFPANYFSLVIASHLIEHLNNPAAFVKEVFRIVRPGGFFMVITPNIAGFQAKLFHNKWRSAIFDHLYLFSIATLSRLLKNEGFVLDKIVSWGGLAAGSAPKLLKKVADKAVKFFGCGDVVLIRSVKK
jgi:2-polyprenyl-3-methyl-5-hydroxy-6-metoxy-1,4-benzoquinol methylase